MSSPASILSLVASLELRLGNGFTIEGEVAKGGMSTGAKVAIAVAVIGGGAGAAIAVAGSKKSTSP